MSDWFLTGGIGQSGSPLDNILQGIGYPLRDVEVGQAVAFTPGTSAENRAAIQGLLDNGGHITFLTDDTYTIDDTLVIKGNTVLDLGAATLRLANTSDGRVRPLIINKSYSDSLDPTGQPTGVFGTPDFGIVIQGGVLDQDHYHPTKNPGGANQDGSKTFLLPPILLVNYTDSRFSGITVRQCQGFGFRTVGLERVLIEEIYFDNAHADGVHIDGPYSDVSIDKITGVVGDDMVAIGIGSTGGGIDAHLIAPGHGEFVRVSRVYPDNAPLAVVKVYGGYGPGSKLWNGDGVQLRGANFTITQANINDSTNIITVANNGLTEGDRLWFVGATPPGGLSASTAYYVRDLSGDDFSVSMVLNGPVADLTTGAGSADTYLQYSHKSVIMQNCGADSVQTALKIQEEPDSTRAHAWSMVIQNMDVRRVLIGDGVFPFFDVNADTRAEFVAFNNIVLVSRNKPLVRGQGEIAFLTINQCDLQSDEQDPNGSVRAFDLGGVFDTVTCESTRFRGWLNVVQANPDANTVFKFSNVRISNCARFADLGAGRNHTYRFLNTQVDSLTTNAILYGSGNCTPKVEGDITLGSGINLFVIWGTAPDRPVINLDGGKLRANLTDTLPIRAGATAYNTSAGFGTGVGLYFSTTGAAWDVKLA